MKAFLGKALARAITAPLLIFAAGSAFAEDWSISAIGNCVAETGAVTIASGGLRATGTSGNQIAAVVRCPLLKETGADTINNVYVRMKRFSTVGTVTPYCYIHNYGTYGGGSMGSFTFAAGNTANQTIDVAVSGQQATGYANLYCVLAKDDMIYGVRYVQDN